MGLQVHSCVTIRGVNYINIFGQGADPGRAKIGHGGALLQESSSSDRKATATNQMDSNDLEAC